MGCSHSVALNSVAPCQFWHRAEAAFQIQNLKEISDILFLACRLQVKRYTPFGQGVRNCLGQQLARMNVPTAVAMFMSEFEFTVAPQVRLNLFLRLIPFSESMRVPFVGACRDSQLCWIEQTPFVTSNLLCHEFQVWTETLGEVVADAITSSCAGVTRYINYFIGLCAIYCLCSVSRHLRGRVAPLYTCVSSAEAHAHKELSLVGKLQMGSLLTRLSVPHAGCKEKHR